MRKLWICLSWLSISLGFLTHSMAVQSVDLVADAQKLYEQLSPSDPHRLQVGLRLADLMFDAALELTAAGNATNDSMAKADIYRKRALHIYEQDLSGVNGDSAIRLKFQMSRLHADLGEIQAAEALWDELSRQAKDPLVRRESTLRLAEMLEISNSRPEIIRAEKLYQGALPLAKKDSLRSYVSFRLAWTRFRLGLVEDAVTSLREALKLADLRERAEMIKDLPLFLSRSSVTVDKALIELHGHETQLKRADLVETLAQSYGAADRRDDQALTLEDLNRHHETMERHIDLLDLRHDHMSPKDVIAQVKAIEGRKTLGVSFSEPKLEAKARDKYIRLLMYWDGQRRAGKQDFAELFTQGVEGALVLFPNTDESKKAVSGWLAAAAEPAARLRRLEEWAPIIALSPKLKPEVDRTKMELARQLGKWNEVVKYSTVVETGSTGSELRAVHYQQAKAKYELGKTDEAMPLFLSVIKEKNNDEMARFSQDLVLDIDVKAKKYSEAIAAAQGWSDLGVRQKEMSDFVEKARFEWAVERQDATSLNEFSEFCFAKKFLPKSCDNALTLSVTLKDSPKLIALLRNQGNDSELAKQLELTGQFAESAQILEKHATKEDRIGSLKIALLYELAGNLTDRDRVLKSLRDRLIQSNSKGKATLSADEQALLYETFSDAGLLDASALQLPFNTKQKDQIVDALYLRGRSPALAKELLAKCDLTGPGWQLAQQENLEALYRKEAAMKFTGRQSQAKFNAKAAALKKVGEAADCMRKGGSPEFRSMASALVSSAYLEFATEIRSVPIPQGLDEETMAQVHANIDKAAEPFVALGDKWQEAARSDLAEVPVESRAAVTANIEKKEWPKPANVSAPVGLKFDWKEELSALQQDPGAKESFARLKEHFDKEGARRLSAYVGGRLEGWAE